MTIFGQTMIIESIIKVCCIQSPQRPLELILDMLIISTLIYFTLLLMYSNIHANKNLNWLSIANKIQ